MNHKNVFGISEKSYDKLMKLFESMPQIERVVIYGSRAMGTYKTGSDIDLTMIGEKLDTHHLTRIMSEIEALSLPYLVDISVLASLTNNTLLEHIKKVGKEFYQRKNPIE